MLFSHTSSSSFSELGHLLENKSQLPLSLSFPQLFVVRNNLLILQFFQLATESNNSDYQCMTTLPVYRQGSDISGSVLRCNYTVLRCHELILV